MGTRELSRPHEAWTVYLLSSHGNLTVHSDCCSLAHVTHLHAARTFHCRECGTDLRQRKAVHVSWRPGHIHMSSVWIKFSGMAQPTHYSDNFNVASATPPIHLLFLSSVLVAPLWMPTSLPPCEWLHRGWSWEVKQLWCVLAQLLTKQTTSQLQVSIVSMTYGIYDIIRFVIMVINIPGMHKFK